VSGLESVLLLLGIFGVPLLLLAGGHRFRRLGRRMRGAFWGGVSGYAVGVVAWAIAAIAPAQMWAQGSVRLSTVVIVPTLLGVAGLGIGAIIGKKPKTRRRHHPKRASPDAREHASTASEARRSVDAQ
tara:strand:- start:205 stop:588 length:384 start_codon:yes stop_codon:yes gene_type:complete